jgi:BirA family biotin operon repressor/biotin-[acetyl-CoA-carboxylase] ligase
VNSPADDWPSDLGRRAVSLSELAGTQVDLNRLTAALIGRVLLAYERFIDGDHIDTFAELWNTYDVLRGREITLSEGGRKRHGRVLGVDDVGSLLLRDDRGRTRGFRAGEVSVEKGA